MVDNRDRLNGVGAVGIAVLAVVFLSVTVAMAVAERSAGLGTHGGGEESYLEY